MAVTLFLRFVSYVFVPVHLLPPKRRTSIRAFIPCFLASTIFYVQVRTCVLQEHHGLFDMSDDESRRDESSEESGDEDSEDGSYDYGFAGGERSCRFSRQYSGAFKRVVS